MVWRARHSSLGDIAEVDLNPVMARADGLAIADARMLLNNIKIKASISNQPVDWIAAIQK